MKHITYTIVAAAALLLASCFEDKGDYDYAPINEITIDTTTIPSAYVAEIAGQLVIDPVIKFSGETIPEEDLSYEWYFYSSAYVAADWYPVSRERKLDLTMIYSAGAYKAALYVTDKRQNITSSMIFDVTLISKISHGMLVFHVNEGVADFDYVATTSTVRELEENFRMRDVFRTINGRPLQGNPLTIRHSATDGRAVNHVYVSTDQELLSLYGRTFFLEHDANSLLIPPMPPRLHFEFIDGQGGSSVTSVFFINDGVLRRIAYGAQYYTDHSIPTPVAVSATLGTDVHLAPFCLRPTTSGSLSYNPMFYDATGQRFVYLASIAAPNASLEPLPTQLPGLFDVNDIGKDLLYVDRGNAYYAFAVLSGGTNDYWLYEIDLPKAGSSSITGATALARGKHDMSALPGIANAVAFDIGTKGHFLLYATGRDIYACDYSGSDPDPAARTYPVTATRINDDFPAGEQITGMKIYRFDGGIYSQGGGGTSDPSYIYYAAMNGGLLYVSTWDGTRGHLYEFALSPVDGRLVSKTPLNRFDDFGRIVDLAVKIQYREAFEHPPDMKQTTTLAAALLLLCTGLSAAPFTILPARPVAGEAIAITYTPTGAVAGSSEITAVIYLCDGDKWRAEDLPVTPANGAWTATYTLPGDCVLLACKFHGDGDTWDSGTRQGHYASHVSERRGDTLVARPGAYVHWGFLRHQLFERYAIPGYSAPGEYIEDNVMQMWISNEFRHFPASRETLSYFAAALVEKMQPGQHADLFLQDIDYILALPSPAELSLLRAAETCRAILHDDARARQIEDTILARFPVGDFARAKEALRLNATRDPAGKAAAARAFIDKFPPAAFVHADDHYANQILLFLFIAEANEADDAGKAGEQRHPLLTAQLPYLPASLLTEVYYRLVQLPLKHELKSHAEVDELSALVHAEMTRRATDTAWRLRHRGAVLSPIEWQREATRHDAGANFTRAEILHRVGRHAEALELLEPLKERYAKGAVFNDLYASVLPAAGFAHLQIPFIEACTREDATTPAMMETLRDDFLARHPGGDFDARVAELRAPGFVEHFEERLRASLVKKPVDPFALDNAAGQRVNIGGAAGKVTVLDFWATWCAPCKAALPGMQVAVDRFRDNPRVQFYFISTLEYAPDYKKLAADFLASKGYRMELLFDDVDPATNKHGDIYNRYAVPFGMRGIPHKVIIDANGNLRWTSSGYYGNPLEMANEISFVVNYLLEEK
ncbi:MAG: redoxin domain-containing protein [Odoribacteraceae bacterium]|jgi:thiol-disulfide isomerase/thioredoxin|nr:redoxin domain-containing protein [Odoribacteraceae bacterium]